MPSRSNSTLGDSASELPVEFGALYAEDQRWFDDMVQTTARMLGMPIALLSVFDGNGQTVLSSTGLDLAKIEAVDTFSIHLLQQGASLVVTDVESDPRFARSSLVEAKPDVALYGGVVLKTEEERVLGTLSVLDTRVGTFSDDKKKCLETMASLINGHLKVKAEANRAERSERRLVEAVDALPDGLVFYDEHDRLVLCNRRYREIYANSADLIVEGARFEDIIRGGVERGQYPEAAGREEAFIRERVRIHQNPGDPIEQELPGDRWLRIQEGRTSDGGLIGFRFDVTQLKRQERELTRMAWTDGLTGILNRGRFMDLANDEFNRARRHQREMAVLVADVDLFKQINDHHGHAAGDQVLVELVERWKSSLRGHDLIGRLGGEEFGVVLPETCEVNAFCVAEKLRQRTADDPFRCGNQNIDVTVSIGIGIVGANAKSVDDVLLVADKSLYEVKRTGRNGCLLLAA